MEENENKKNSRVFYLTLAVVMAVVLVLIIASSTARRNMPDTDTNPSDTSSGLEDDTQTGLENDNNDTLPTFSLPVSGEIVIDYSDSVPVFSQTMNDYRTHLGVDILSPLGTEVKAVADGVVTNVWKDPFMGTCITVEHSGNAVSVYKNLDPEVKDGIIIGASVKAGDVIGAVGESAMNEIAEEPHLHYELKVDGKHVDPKKHFDFTQKKPDESTNEGSNTENQQ